MSRAPCVADFGLTRTPFSKAVAAGDLYTGAAHAEAVARIGFCVSESALGVIVGDVVSSKPDVCVSAHSESWSRRARGLPQSG